MPRIQLAKIQAVLPTAAAMTRGRQPFQITCNAQSWLLCHVKVSHACKLYIQVGVLDIMRKEGVKTIEEQVTAVGANYIEVWFAHG